MHHPGYTWTGGLEERSMKKFAVMLVILVLVAATAAAGGYVVVLKNGSKIRAREPIQIKGHQAIVTLPNGTVTSIPLDQVDLVETERYNQLGLGDAIVMEGVGVGTPVPTPTPTPPLGATGRLRDLGVSLGRRTTPTPTPTPSIGLKTVEYPNHRVTEAFTNLFDQKHLYLYKTSVGTRPDAFFVQVITDSQREVFHALKTVAEAYALIHELEPGIAPRVLELQLVTSVNKPAGTFRITPEQADQLAQGQISPEAFYLKHVIF